MISFHLTSKILFKMLYFFFSRCLDCCRKPKDSEINEFIRLGKIELATQAILSKKYIIDNTNLIYACYLGNLDLIRLLAIRGCNLKTSSEMPLTICVRLNYPEIVRFLVQSGCNPRMKNDYLLMVAAEYNNLEIVRFLISVGCDYLHPELLPRCISGYGDVEMVRYLASLGCNPRISDDICLELADRFRDVETAKFLVSVGCDIKKIKNLRKQLGFVPYSKLDLKSIHTDPNCPICICFSTSDFVKLNSCSHVFHKDCLERYLAFQDKNTTCPVCRSTLF